MLLFNYCLIFAAGLITGIYLYETFTEKKKPEASKLLTREDQQNDLCLYVDANGNMQETAMHHW